MNSSSKKKRTLTLSRPRRGPHELQEALRAATSVEEALDAVRRARGDSPAEVPDPHPFTSRQQLPLVRPLSEPVEPMYPRMPGLLATPEEIERWEAYEAVRKKVEEESAAAGRPVYVDRMPASTLMLDLFADGALAGDTRQAQSMMLAIAEEIEAGDATVLDDPRVRRFLVEALRRVAKDRAASAAVSKSNKFKGGKLKAGRPVETRKQLNTALAVARNIREGMTLAEAKRAVVNSRAPFAPKDVRSVTEAWAAWDLLASAVAAEHDENSILWKYPTAD